MAIMYDFLCNECEAKFEALVNSDVKETVCRKCGAEHAKRLISAPRISLDGTDPSFPGAYDKWARDHEQKTKQEAKVMKEHGSTNLGHA